MKLNVNLTSHVYRGKNAKKPAFSLFICTWFQLSARSCPQIFRYFLKRKLLLRDKQKRAIVHGLQILPDHKGTKHINEYVDNFLR